MSRLLRRLFSRSVSVPRKTRKVRRASDLRARQSGLRSRVEVLEGLERSHEGFGAGAREVFALLEQADAGPWATRPRRAARQRGSGRTSH